MTIAAVGSFARSLTEGLAREGRTILGGDIAFSLLHREASADERAFLERQGTSRDAATMRAMARDRRRQVRRWSRLKAVDSVYPLYGTLRSNPAMPLADALAMRDGVLRRGGRFGAAGAARSPARRAHQRRQRHRRIARRDRQRARQARRPASRFGPRLLVSIEALRATGLLQPGSLVRWTLSASSCPDNAANDRATDAVADRRAEQQLPQAGWEMRSRANASPSLERNIERFTQFLTLVGLTALLVGGVGVANAVKSYRRAQARRHRDPEGARRDRRQRRAALSVPGDAARRCSAPPSASRSAPRCRSWSPALFGTVLPLPVAPALYPGELALAAGYGLLTALAFAIWPLGRAHDVPVSALFRDAVAPDRRWPRRRYVVATVLDRRAARRASRSHVLRPPHRADFRRARRPPSWSRCG